jgi:aminoglycoside phosphotransferase (APT) family kinase protein
VMDVPNPMPAADVDVSTDLVRLLLAEQHPDLAQLPVEFMANGWDNAIFRIGDTLLARLPRREPAAGSLLNEQRWLPVLAPHLQLPIPYPERTGLPAHGYPWTWGVVPYLPGVPATSADGLDLASVAAALGGFLGSLHAPAPPDAPANPYRGVPLADRAQSFAANLSAVSGLIDRDAVRRVWQSALAAPVYAGPPLWLHGDLHPANILVSRGRVSGVIDFGDLTSGDPATDLAVAWMLLPLPSHAAFRTAYRSAAARHGSAALIDEAVWTRSRGWALNLAIVFLAHSADNPQLENVGRRTLRRVLTGPDASEGVARRRNR